MNEIQLPKGYISFSQMTLWEKSPERYRRLYFDSESGAAITNAGMTFGSRVADALEHGKETGDLLTDTAMELLPKYDVQDQEITARIKTKDGDVPILGRPDSMCSKTYSFFEFKTGKVPWTQAKAEKTDQLPFYAVLIYLKYGVIPPEVSLVWMETFVDDDGETRPTGKIEKFDVKIELQDIIEMMAKISRIAKEIESEFVLHQPKPEETIEEFMSNN